MRNKAFKLTSTSKVPKSLFDLSYTKTGPIRMGRIYPICVDEVVPADFLSINFRMIIRLLPMVAPMMHEVNAYVHYFFVPYRLLWDSWEDFITGGRLGTDATATPKWTGAVAVSSVQDWFGWPIVAGFHADFQPVLFPLYAYNLIYNEYYIPRDVLAPLTITVDNGWLSSCWEKDYLCGALPFQQRGTSPAIPASDTSADWATALFDTGTPTTPIGLDFEGNAAFKKFYLTGSANAATSAESAFDDNTVSLAASIFDIHDIRLAAKLTQWMEVNARCGSRYKEFLAGHFGIRGFDSRLDRPEYIGGAKVGVLVNEVLQTGPEIASESTPPAGEMYGHGIAVDSQHIGKYRVKEYGLIMGLLTVRPRTMYHEGVNRQWIKRDRYDYYHPEFANLSEQPIENGEVFVANTSADAGTWGYQGRYSEMRYKPSTVHGLCHPGQSLDHWTLARHLSSLPALNDTFLTCTPSDRVFASTGSDTMILHYANVIKAARPLPIEPKPGIGKV